MLKNRIIPILLLKNGRCVKGKQFANFRDTGAPVSAAKVYDAQRVDELVFLDIMASREERETLLPIITETAEECFMLFVRKGSRRQPAVRCCNEIEGALVSQVVSSIPGILANSTGQS